MKGVALRGMRVLGEKVRLLWRGVVARRQGFAMEEEGEEEEDNPSRWGLAAAEVF
jgi:hypothetical protein